MNTNVSVNHIVSSLNSYGNKYNISTKKTKAFDDKSARSVAEKCNYVISKCRSLSKADYSSGASVSTMKKIANFVDSYNKLVKSSSDTSNSTLTTQLKKMKQYITDNESALNKVGITFKDDKLAIDKETLTDIKTRNKFVDLFTGSGSFISNIQKCADKAYKSLKIQTVDTEVQSCKTIMISDTASECALSANNLNGLLGSLTKQSYTTDNKESLIELVNMYTDKYNNLLDKYSYHNDSATDSQAQLIQNIIDSSSTHADILNNIGISISNTDNKLVITDSAVLNNSSIENLSNVFKSSDYSESVTENARELFASLVDASHAGITINGYA